MVLGEAEHGIVVRHRLRRFTNVAVFHAGHFVGHVPRIMLSAVRLNLAVGGRSHLIGRAVQLVCDLIRACAGVGGMVVRLSKRVG